MEMKTYILYIQSDLNKISIICGAFILFILVLNAKKLFKGWGHQDRKIEWVSWEVICKPKHIGDLGIKDLRNFN